MAWEAKVILLIVIGMVLLAFTFLKENHTMKVFDIFVIVFLLLIVTSPIWVLPLIKGDLK